MIRVNVMPLAARKGRDASGVSLPLRQIGAGAGVFAVTLTLVLLAGNQWGAHRLQRLQKQWEQLQVQKAGLEQNQKQLQQLQGQASVLEHVKAKQGRWAPRLSLLSEALVPEVWFTGFKFQPGQPVRLEGSALVDGSGESGAAVTRFLQRLKEQPDFGEWFSGVDLKTVEHRQIGQVDVVDFEILLAPSG